MGLLRLLLVLAAVSAGAPALAEPAPTIAPAPAWVEAAAIPAANPKLADKPLQSLLVAPQTRYGADGTVEYYMEWATAVQNPQGLTATGNIVLAWQPEQSDLIVHKVRLLRAGKPIDLLANGQQFTVLRRESNLESAMLDGVLTAVMQPEGLSVGDVVNVAYTIRTRPGAVAFRGENLLILSHGSPTRVASFREIWENGVETRWRADPAIGAAKLSKSRWGTELRIELRDAEGPEPPANAPARYRLPPGLEVSQYRDWNEIGRILAPLYTSARTLKADSPLKAEIARIAAASSDPKARAMAALRLVQDKIRYLALNMGEGGYVPAAADQTWSRKFGDCKGKTVTLLALLDGLGIEAEPVLISTGFGETLSERLPQVRVFDHVLVRARIDGRSYWLDGTRLGDRRIEDLASSGLGWGLPVTAQGAALEQLPLTPPEQPMMEAKIIYDASAGFDHPVAVTGEIAVRGDVAMVLRQAISQAGREALLEQTRRSFAEKRADEEVTSFDIKEDEASGAVLFSFTGKTNMNWARPSSGGGFRFRFSNDTFENNVELDREPGPYKDIPFALPYPAYATQTETVILPNRGQGFTIEGHAVDRTAAGGQYRRTAAIENGRAIVHSSYRQMERELPAAQAGAAKDALAELEADNVYVRTPADYRMADAERALILASAPTTESGYTDRGYERLFSGKLEEATADFDQAIVLAPRSARAHANRALSLVYRNELEQAEAALARATALTDGEGDFVISQAEGLIHLARAEPADAVAALSRAISIDSENLSVLQSRAEAYEQLGRMADAMADLDRSLGIEPNDAGALEHKARLAAFRGDEALALATADRLAALEDSKAEGLEVKAGLLGRFGKTQEAAAAYAEAIAELDRRIAAASGDDEKRRLQREKVSVLLDSGRPREAIDLAGLGLRARAGSVTELNTRCWTRVLANMEVDEGLRDCEQALKRDPEDPAVTDSRAWAKLRLGRVDDAIADFDAALRRVPQQSASLYGRGLAKLRKGDKEGGERDIAAARRIDFDVEARFGRYGLAP